MVKLYAEKDISAGAFASDDGDFITNQDLEGRATFEVRKSSTVRLITVAVDASGDYVAASGTYGVDVVEAIPRTEFGDTHQRKPYITDETTKLTTQAVGESVDVPLEPGLYALRFHTGASLPAAAKLRFYLAT